MRLISLNIWGGKMFNPLLTFFHSQAAQTDIFCLQEVFTNRSKRWEKYDPAVKAHIYSAIEKILPNFVGRFAPSEDDGEGLAIFVKKGLPVVAWGDTFVYRQKNARADGESCSKMGRNVQYITYQCQGKTYFIANFHGLWTGNGKGDTPERLEQSNKLKALIDSFTGARILAGDFNLLPDTESLRILENGARNLIKDFNVQSTRSHFYTKEPKFADYILVSPEISVREFKVLSDSVSDHLPLLLDFE